MDRRAANKGHLIGTGETPVRAARARRLPDWQKRAADAVGTAIEFWGFKANHGRVWTALYMQAEPQRAQDLQALLGMSKGAVSMITRELEQHGVIHRVRPYGSNVWRFEAETDLFRMIRRTIEQREAKLVARIEADLEQAEADAARAGADPAALERIRRLRTLARRAAQALDAFVRTARLDMAGISDLLVGSGRRLLGRKGR